MEEGRNKEENKDKNKEEGNSFESFAKMFYLILGVSFVLFMVLLVSSGPKIPKTLPGSSYKQPDSQSSSSSPSSSSSSPQGLPVSTSLEKRGEFLVITTKVENKKSYAVNGKLSLYVVDSMGSKHFIDLVYIELESGQTGKSESSIKAADSGPPPYTVVTEWKN